VAVRPRLKDVLWERAGEDLRLVYDRRDQLVVGDPTGTVERLLELLRDGGRTVPELAEALALGVPEVTDAVARFDKCGLLEDGERLGTFVPPQSERYFSNLAFFESFASLERSRDDFQHTLRDAHILVLGTGGLNANTVPHLAGLGVGRLTLLDHDAVAPRNFARQYFYRWADIGTAKVRRAAEWVRDFDPTVHVDAVDRRIEGPEDLAALLDRTRPDVVAAGIDYPAGVDTWVNAACVGASVPYVRGGMYVTEGIVWSVQPGRSACRACVSDEVADPDAAEELAGLRLYRRKQRTNRGIGPVAGLLGALGAFEILRLLTGFEPAAYAGRPLFIDFAGGCATRQVEWPRDPACAVCGPARTAAGTTEEVNL
jgi:molybdopterin/thiamine biosynthesis adenylyltransferase